MAESLLQYNVRVNKGATDTFVWVEWRENYAEAVAEQAAWKRLWPDVSSVIVKRNGTDGKEEVHQA